MRFLYLVLLSILVAPVAFSYIGTPWASTGTCVQQGTVSFTFDDGVSKYNDYLLDLLDREGIKAGFFIVGDTLYTKKRRDGLKRIYAGGHLLLNHSYSHPDLTKLTRKEIMNEITKADALIKKYTGVSPYKIIRPPFGRINSQTYAKLKSLGYSIALWNLDSYDWDYSRSKEDLWKVYVRMFNHADPKNKSFIILQHDRRLDSIELIPDIAKLAKSKGFRIVSFEECYNLQGRSKI